MRATKIGGREPEGQSVSLVSEFPNKPFRRMNSTMLLVPYRNVDSL